MMNYGDGQRDLSRLAILTKAIDVLSQQSAQDAIPVEALIEFIDEKDPSLINEVGRLDVKLFDRLVQDLETLRLNHGDLLEAQGEPLEIEALLGLGRARDVRQDAAEHHQHEVPREQPGRAVLGRPVPDGGRPVDRPVAGAGRDAPGRAHVRRGRPLPSRRPAAREQGADGAPAAPGTVGRAGAAAGHPEPRRLRLSSAATTSAPGSSARSRRRTRWPR